MTVEEIVVLLQNQFDEELFDHIIKRYTPLYKHCSRYIIVPDYDLQDYLQEGRIIMLEAIEMFDTTKQDVFSGFYKLLYKNRIINLSRAERAFKRGGGIREVPLDYYSSKTQEAHNYLDIIENNYHISAYESLEIKEVLICF